MPSIHESASSTLSLTDSAAFNWNKIALVNTQIYLIETLFVSPHQEFPSHTVGITDLAEQTFVFETASSTISLSDLAEARGGTYDRFPGDTLSFSQEASSNIKPVSATSTLNFVELLRLGGPVAATAADDLTNPVSAVPSETTVNLGSPLAIFQDVGLRDGVTFGGVFNKPVTSYLSFAQPAARTLELSASNHMNLAQTMREVEYEIVTHYLYFQHTTAVDSVEFANQAISFTDAVSFNVVYVRSATSDLDLSDQDSDGVTIRSADAAAAYVVYAAANEPCTTPFTRRSTILLTYPYPIYTHSYEIRAPEFRDNQQLEFRRINRLTRGATLKMFRDPAWPAAERLIYNFDSLTQAEIKSYFEFVQVSIGKEIGLLDFESRQWRGFILTPDSTGQEEGVLCNFDLFFEFEGIEDPDAAIAGVSTTEGLAAAISGTGALAGQATDIPPGFQAALTSSSQFGGDVRRE